MYNGAVTRIQANDMSLFIKIITALKKETDKSDLFFPVRTDVPLRLPIETVEVEDAEPTLPPPGDSAYALLSFPQAITPDSRKGIRGLRHDAKKLKILPEERVVRCECFGELVVTVRGKVREVVGGLHGILKIEGEIRGDGGGGRRPERVVIPPPLLPHILLLHHLLLLQRYSPLHHHHHPTLDNK